MGHDDDCRYPAQETDYTDKSLEQHCKTDNQLKVLRLRAKLGSTKAIVQQTGMTKQLVNSYLRKIRAHRDKGNTFEQAVNEKPQKPVAGGSIEAPIPAKGKITKKRIVFTSAQNNTHIHANFFKSLQTYCKHNDAQLVVGVFEYNKNPFHNGEDDDVWYDPLIRPYIINVQTEIALDLIWCGELNILPTAVDPISGLHNYTGDKSCIIPHVKAQFETVATAEQSHAKQIHTTGAITQRNYIQKKAGQKAQHHHIFGALVIEIDDDGDWFARKINAESDTGAFYDLDAYYTKDGVKTDCRVSAVTPGDLHVNSLRDVVKHAIWRDEESIIRTLKPTYVFGHDIHDHGRRNHHNVNDPYVAFKLHMAGTESVKDEIRLSTEVMREITQFCDEFIIVESNHDLALERWLKEQDYKKDPVNALFFLELQLANYRKMAKGEKLQTFQTACEMVDVGALKGVRFLRTDESFLLHGIQNGNHGDRGPNGARGTANSFRRMGNRQTIGHGHSPYSKDGIDQVGASILPGDTGYAKGPSGWSITLVITYDNGKRTHVTVRLKEVAGEMTYKWRA